MIKNKKRRFVRHPPLKVPQYLRPALNNTKWREIRLAFGWLNPRPSYVTLCVNGFRAPPDSCWQYHLPEGGYKVIEALDILAETPEEREEYRQILKRIHVPGEEIPESFRIYAYIRRGQSIDYA